MLHYVQEFSQMGDKGYRSLVDLAHTPEQPCQVYVEQESEDFFGVKLRNKKSGESRLLFTLWAADIGSGVRARVRWSTNGKALQITGDTKGFSYRPIPDADPSKYESFNFIYLVDEEKLYSVPRGEV